ncbi:MAG TPA: hypothetical protein VN752_10510 [Solirubrobacterales bacterium]|nr:hypothetical protein [Solirubrobacterales bacterium]
MKRSVNVWLGTLAQAALFGEEQGGVALASSRLERAIRCYLNDRDSGRLDWPYPGFLDDVGEDGVDGERSEVEVLVDQGLWRELGGEAERQQVSPERLLEHATLYYAAELDAGRITRRILADLDEDPDQGS